MVLREWEAMSFLKFGLLLAIKGFESVEVALDSTGVPKLLELLVFGRLVGDSGPLLAVVGFG